jgi:ATP-dependent RNA helicase HelY
LTDLLDRIQAGRTAEPEVRYFLSRLRAGEGEEQDADRPVAMKARKAGRAAEFETVLEIAQGRTRGGCQSRRSCASRRR